MLSKFPRTTVPLTALLLSAALALCSFQGHRHRGLTVAAVLIEVPVEVPFHPTHAAVTLGHSTEYATDNILVKAHIAKDAFKAEMLRLGYQEPFKQVGTTGYHKVHLGMDMDVKAEISRLEQLGYQAQPNYVHQADSTSQVAKSVASKPTYVTSWLLVKSTVGGAEFSTAMQSLGYSVLEPIGSSGWHKVQLGPGMEVEKELKRLTQQGYQAELDQIIHLDLHHRSLKSAEVSEPGAATPTEGSVRLYGGNTTQGRLEVYKNGTWGTVCGNYGVLETPGTWVPQVACRQMGLPWTQAHLISSSIASDGAPIPDANATTPIAMRFVSCDGAEEKLADCTQVEPAAVCYHSLDLVVACLGSPAPPPPAATATSAPLPQPLALRLQGPNSSYGRLEVFYNSTWGTVCYDYSFSAVAAQVACRQMGLPWTTASYSYYSTVYPTTLNESTPVWLEGLACSLDDALLGDCPHKAWGQSSCKHAKDVALECTGDDPGHDAESDKFTPNGTYVIQASIKLASFNYSLGDFITTPLKNLLGSATNQDPKNVVFTSVRDPALGSRKLQQAFGPYQDMLISFYIGYLVSTDQARVAIIQLKAQVVQGNIARGLLQYHKLGPEFDPRVSLVGEPEITSLETSGPYDTPTSGHHSWAMPVGIAVGIGGAAILALIATAMVVALKRRRQAGTDAKWDVQHTQLGGNEAPVFKSDLEKADNGLTASWSSGNPDTPSVQLVTMADTKSNS